MARYALILAGGDGTRAGGGVPKQFRELLGIPMLWWAVRSFHESDPSTNIIIVMHPGFFDDWDIMYRLLPEADRDIKVTVVCGGRDRIESTANGLMAVDGDESLVAVHDAARPVLSPELVSRLWRTAEIHHAAIPCVPEVNSLRRKMPAETEGFDTVPVDRAEFMAVQTPQVFRKSVLDDAFGKMIAEGRKPLFTDDASIVQSAGFPVFICDGDPDNIKVTTPSDFAIAEALLKMHR